MARKIELDATNAVIQKLKKPINSKTIDTKEDIGSSDYSRMGMFYQSIRIGDIYIQASGIAPIVRCSG